MTPTILHADAARLAEAVAARLRTAVEVNPRAALVLSGGGTPGPAYRRFAERTSAATATVTLADERWVPPDHPRSNAALLRDCLGDAWMARFGPLWRGAGNPEADAEAATDALGALRPFEVVLLGMGDDGHTASLFPDDPAVAALLDPAGAAAVRAVHPPGQPEPRLTWTLAGLLDAKLILVVLKGEAKLAVLERALAGDDPREMPIRAVLRHGADRLEIHASR